MFDYPWLKYISFDATRNEAWFSFNDFSHYIFRDCSGSFLTFLFNLVIEPGKRLRANEVTVYLASWGWLISFPNSDPSWAAPGTKEVACQT